MSKEICQRCQKPRAKVSFKVQFDHCKQCDAEIKRKLIYETQKDLEQYIKESRENGARLEVIAAATGLDQSTISYYMAGKRTVGPCAAKKYLEHLKGNE